MSMATPSCSVSEDDRVEATVAAGTGCGNGEEALPARKGWMATRMPKEEVDLILSMEGRRRIAEPNNDYEDKRKLFSQEMVEDKRQQAKEESETVMRDKFLAFQDWVRGEVKEKGYVEVPDELLADREQLREWIEEELKEMFDRLDFSEAGFGNYSDEDRRMRRRFL